MKVIIISVVPYQEKDGIVTAISKEETFTFTVKGILCSTSKNSSLNIPLTIADIELGESNAKYQILKSSKVLFSPLESTPTLEYLTSLNLISQCLKSLDESEQFLMFDVLENGLKSLKNKKYFYLSIISILCRILEIAGFALEANKCVLCNSKKDIIGFSFVEGGFICRNCRSGGDVSSLNINQMKVIRAAIITKNFDYSPYSFDLNDEKTVLKELLIFFEDSTGLNLANSNLLLK